jgi:hypothetical protein
VGPHGGLAELRVVEPAGVVGEHGGRLVRGGRVDVEPLDDRAGAVEPDDPVRLDQAFR